MNRKNTKVAQMKIVYEMQAELYSALSSPIRLQILDLLSNGKTTSTVLLELLEIPKANLSQHISVLKESGIIQSEKKGKFQYLSLTIPKIKDACTLVRTVLIEKMALEERKNSQLIRELRAQK